MVQFKEIGVNPRRTRAQRKLITSSVAMDFNQEDGNRPIPELMRPGFITMSALQGFRARAVDLVWLRDRSDPHKNDAKQNNSS